MTIVKMGFILGASDEVVGDSDTAVVKVPYCGLFGADFWFPLILSKWEPKIGPKFNKKTERLYISDCYKISVKKERQFLSENHCFWQKNDASDVEPC